MPKKVRIGDKLVEHGYITKEQLDWGLSVQKSSGKRLGEFLVDEGLITETLLIDVLKELLNIESTSLYDIDEIASRVIPENICKRYNVFAFKIDKDKIYVAMSDPQDREAIQDIRRISKREVEVYIASTKDINRCISKVYANSEIDRAINEYSQVKRDVNEESLPMDGEENSAPVVRFVNNILENAVRMEASDIHIEQFNDYMRVRFRIDGMLTEYLRGNTNPYKAIVSRIKLMSNINISETRLPQDGRIYFKVDNRDIDFRVSTMPTNKYEKVVMRVLDKSTFMAKKENLGIDEHGSRLYDDLISNPYGLILVVGPTGSGKTTTLYSMLNQLNTIERNILTIEDPIEYELSGINQSQINFKAGLTFASGLRAFMRQDPDIIMVGEIRDTETAEISIRASLTGHLVLSTLHANTAVGSISRLLDMGVDGFKVASSLIGVISQRLARKVCDKCKKAYEADSMEKSILGFDQSEKLELYRGEGCKECNHTGYKDRVGIYEILKVSQPIKDMISLSATEKEIFDKAVELGMLDLKQDMRKKVLQGQTTVQEMIRVILTTD